MFKAKYYTGGVADTRPEEEKLKDWTHEELFGMTAPTWTEFREGDIPKTTIRNQDGSSACGAFALTKALGLNNWMDEGKYVDLNPAYVYRLRANYPAEGMSLNNLMDIAVKHGASSLAPFQYEKVGEPAINTYTSLSVEDADAKKYRAKNYVYVSIGNTDQIAKAVYDGYFPVLLIRCSIKEWTSEPAVISGLDPKKFEIAHFVPIIYCGLKDGQKMFVVDDSWGSSYGRNGRRYVSEDFIKARGIACAYTVDMPNNIVPSETVSTPNKLRSPLVFGLTNNKDVVILQNMLKELGFLDKKIPSSGNYYTMTAQAVYKFQVANKVDALAILNRLAGKTVGARTVDAINSKFA